MPLALAPCFCDENRQRFGALLLAWRERAGWAHDTLAKWGDQAGFLTPRNSTFSRLERGLIVQPDLTTFSQLGECNARLVFSEYGKVSSRDLLRKLKAQQPITGSDGLPWGCVEFFACFMGRLEPPSLN